MLFSRLIETNSRIWDKYLHHEFVKRLENGSLKEENFLFYLKQDYIYLIHYVKCYTRLALNTKNAEELRFAIKFQNYIIEGEIELRKSILKLGINTDKLNAKDESLTDIAYTRYTLSVGESGNFLDMLVALDAYVIGYGYIGAEIYKRLSKEKLQGHPYKEWILIYSSDEFQSEIKEFEGFLNSYTQQVSQEKFENPSEIFYNVVHLENAFWKHTLRMKVDI